MYTTIYKKKNKKIVETLAYKTKSHTPAHERLRREFNGETYKGGKLVYFVLGQFPTIIGGERVG